MSLLPKNEWLDWAREWGLTHHAQRGWLYRNEHVVGLHDGVLVQVGWGGDKHASLVVRLRFPRTADVEGLRRALIADASLDGLPGKGAARTKTTIVKSAPQGLRLAGRPEFTLDDTSLVWYRGPSLTGLKAREVPAWVGLLVAALRRATPGFDGRCEQCSTGAARQFVLVDDVPMMLCGPCQERLRAEGEMAERAYDLTEARHLQGAAFGAAAALAGAIAWAGFAVLTNRMFGVAAIGIGALVSWAYRRAAGRLDAAGRWIGSVLTVASVVFGQVLFYAWQVSRLRPDIGFRLVVGWRVYESSWIRQPGVEAIAIFFGLIGAAVAAGALKRPSQHREIRDASRDPREVERRAM